MEMNWNCSKHSQNTYNEFIALVDQVIFLGSHSGWVIEIGSFGQAVYSFENSWWIDSKFKCSTSGSCFWNQLKLWMFWEHLLCLWYKSTCMSHLHHILWCIPCLMQRQEIDVKLAIRNLLTLHGKKCQELLTSTTNS